MLLLDVRFTIDIVPSRLNVAGALWGFLFTALIALLLARFVEEQADRRSWWIKSDRC